MKALLRLLSLLIGLLAILLFRWIASLVTILRDLWQKLKRWLERRALTERERKATDAPCVPINQEAVPGPTH